MLSPPHADPLELRCRCFVKPANLIAESEVYMKNQDIKTAIYKVICVAAKNHGQNFSQSIAWSWLRTLLC